MTTTITKPVRSCAWSDDTDTFAIESFSFANSPTRTDGSRSLTSDVLRARIDEADIPDWVYHKFSPLNEDAVFPAVQTRRRPLSKTATRTPHASTGEPSVSDLIHLQLARSGYPLQHVRCWSDGQTLSLSGFVTRYFYAQIAVEIALKLANGRRIEVHIEVIPSAAPSRSADN